MNKLEKLLEGVEVEWKTLGEVAVSISSGGTPRTGVEEYYGGNIPWLRTQEVGTGEIWDTDIKITELGLKNSSAKMIPANCVIVAMYGATVGKVGINKIPLCTNQACANIQINKTIANYRYVYHFLLSQYEYIKSLGTGSQTNINSKIVKSLLIPIPPLEVQKEIVRILDKFSTLTAELQAELQARKSQYEYYRDQLLAYPLEESDQPSLRSGRSDTSIQNSDNSSQPQSVLNLHSPNSVLQPQGKVVWKTLGEVAEYSHERIGAATMKKTNYVGVDNLLQNKAGKTESNYVPTVGNLTAYTVGDILIGNIRPYLKKIWQADCNGGTNGDVLVIHLTDKSVDTRYLYQVLSDDKFFVYNMQHAKGAKMPRGNKQKIMEYSIPIPPISEQERIVTILDKFDTLVNSITEGLPKEIELRQKQYEYFRDKLLSFPRRGEPMCSPNKDCLPQYK